MIICLYKYETKTDNFTALISVCLQVWNYAQWEHTAPCALGLWEQDIFNEIQLPQVAKQRT